jgi:hypothetical protein
VTITINDNESYQCRLIDYYGRILFAGNVQNTSRIDIRNLAKGMYFIQLSNKNKVLISKKLLLNN